MKNYFALFFVVLCGVGLLVVCGCGPSAIEKEAADFVARYNAEVAPLYHNVQILEFTAYASGKDEDFEKYTQAKMAFDQYHANKASFELVKKYRAAKIGDPLVKRSLNILFNNFAPKQADPKKMELIANIESDIAKKFQNYRAVVNGKEITDNEVEEMLKTVTDSSVLKATWEASKQVGAVVADDVKKIVKLRNEVARELGYRNFHEMSLLTDDQNPQDVEAVFDELDALTRDAFIKVKAHMDEVLAKRLGIAVEDLAPWDYQNRFFQEAPQIYNVTFDDYYKGKDVAKLAADFYQGLGMEVADVVDKSDLYERPGKYQHAACWSDNAGDVRMMLNIKSNEQWMTTMLHELGHAMYAKYDDSTLPFVLRGEAHIFTTEAIAEFMGSLATNPQWLKDMVGISEQEKEKIAPEAIKSQQLAQLVFSRWSQVMYRFEKALYENPDQDVGKLWWDMVEKYQLVKRPAGRSAPDWASKIHLATAPCYYHNYLLGQVLGAQLRASIAKELKVSNPRMMSMVGQLPAGQFLRDKVFKPAARWYWNDMIEKATGEKLTAKYYAAELKE